MNGSGFKTSQATVARVTTGGWALVGLVVCALPARAQNLIYNGNFELGPTGFYTEYILWSAGSAEGLFDIRAYPETWHPFFAPCRDHTGAGNRWMMVVNGDTHPVLWAYQLNVEPASAYRFRFWYVTLYPTNPARILTRIRREAPAPSGTWVDMPEFQFTASTDCIWRNADFVWFSGDTTQITIILWDQESRDSGNDFALDDMELVRLDCTLTTTPPSDRRACQGGAAAFTVSASGLGSIGVQWEREGPANVWSALADGLTPSGSVISGANAMTLTVSNVSPADAGRYRAIFWSECNSVIGDPATLTLLAGDADGNGAIDQDDLDIVLFNFGATGLPPFTNGDMDGDGDVDQDDLDGVLFNFDQLCA